MKISQLKNLEDLKSLIDLNNPTVGENLTFFYYEKIKNSKGNKNNNNDWNETFNLCVEALNLSKDLNVACWMLEAITCEKNLEGLYIGISFIDELIKKYSNIFPTNIESQINCFEWINNHVLEWLTNEIILQEDGKFSVIYTDLYNNKFNKEILKKYSYNKEYSIEKLNLIDKIQNILTNMKDFSFYFSSLINFFYKVKIFYNNCENYLNTNEMINKKENISDNNEIDSKEEIFNDINTLVIKGLNLDKNDVLLYLIYKICLLRNKPITEIINLIKENQLSKLLN
jgi:hypothetical protein